MNRTLTPGEVSALETLVRPMTKAEKLRRFAQIVREARRQFFIFSGLEHYGRDDRSMLSHPSSAFALAAQDPTLRQAGLQNDTLGEVERFFGLSPEELHAFSCNCGGHLTSERMADRIEAIAAGAT